MGNEILAATSKSSGGSSYLFLLVIVAVLVLMYFVTIRPQRRRQQQAMQTQREIRPGQRVRTTAGMYATVAALDGDDVILEVSPGVEMRFMRRAIMEVLPDGGTGFSGPDGAGEYSQSAEYTQADGYASDDAGQEEDVPGTGGAAGTADDERPAGR